MFKLEEIVKTDRLAYLIGHYEELGLSEQNEVSYYQEDTENLKPQLEKYLRRLKKGVADVNYRQNGGKGRYFALGLTLQRIRKDIKNCIIEGLYVDIDIKNCHPVVLSYICDKQDIQTPCLDYYIKNREEVLNEFEESRSDAKTVILKILNGGFGYYDSIENKSKWFIEYYYEIKNVINSLAKGKEYDKFEKKYMKESKKDNPKGSYVNLMICEIENEIIMTMYKKLGKPKKSVLCFDGIMVPIIQKFNLKELEKEIRRKVGIRIELVQKEIKNEINIPCDILLPKYVDVRDRQKLNYFDHNDKYDFHKFREEFNHKEYDSLEDLEYELLDKYHRAITYITLGSGYFILKLAEKDTYQTSIVDRLGNNNFPVFYKEDNKKKKILIQDFLIKEVGYKKVECKLSNSYEKNFNLWSGFKAKYTDIEEDEGCEMMKKFIFETWASSNQEYYNYIISWLAGLVNTNCNNGVALVLVSDQGTGKGFVYEFIKNYVIGKWSAIDVQGLESLTGKYNEFIENKRLVLINEMCSTRDTFHSSFDKIKANITDPTLQIKRRYVDSYSIENIGNYILCSNHRDSVIVSASDRRYTMFEVSNCYKGNTSFFNELARKAYNQKSGDAFYTYLKQFKCVNVKEIIETNLRQDAKDISLSSTMKFIKSIEEVPLRNSSNKLILRLTAIALYARYRTWSQENGERCVSSTKFGLEVKKKLEKKRTNKGVVYVLPKVVDVLDDDMSDDDMSDEE
jgi:hypothetical protein